MTGEESANFENQTQYKGKKRLKSLVNFPPIFNHNCVKDAYITLHDKYLFGTTVFDGASHWENIESWIYNIF